MNNIFTYLISSELQRQVFLPKIIFYFLSFLLLISTSYFLWKSNYLKIKFRKQIMKKDFHDFKSKHSRRHSKQWAKIIKLLKSESKSEDKLAVIKARSLVKEILEELGFQGKVLPEILEKVFSQNDFNIKEIQWADEIYQQIVENSKYKLDHSEAKQAVEIFSEVLKKLNYF